MDHRPILLLDLDDTILDFVKAEHRAIERTFRDMGLEPDRELIERYSRINSQQWARLEAGEISRQEVLEGRFRILFRERDLDLDPVEAKEKYENYLSQGHFFMPGAPELLEELKGGYRLFLCSNGTAQVQAGRLDSAGIAGYFEKIFISQDLGYDKPDPRYFQACFDQIPGFSRENCVMIGDRLSSDILGGIQAKIKTCWVNFRRQSPDPAIVPDRTVYGLEELPQVLKELLG